MIPKDKALQLVNRYYRDSDLLVEDLSWIQSKECALITVDVILIDCGAKDWSGDEACEGKNYWQEVKNEINNL